MSVIAKELLWLGFTLGFFMIGAVSRLLRKQFYEDEDRLVWPLTLVFSLFTLAADYACQRLGLWTYHIPNHMLLLLGSYITMLWSGFQLVFVVVEILEHKSVIGGKERKGDG